MVEPPCASQQPSPATAARGMHRHRFEYSLWCTSHALARSKYCVRLLSRVSPDDSTSRRWHKRHYGVHKAPFPPALVMIVSECCGWFAVSHERDRLGNVVSIIRTLIIYLKCTIILGTGRLSSGMCLSENMISLPAISFCARQPISTCLPTRAHIENK